MAWCEMNQVNCVFRARPQCAAGRERSASNSWQAEAEASATGKPARHFKDFRYATLDSWSRRRRVVAKAEWTNGEANPRFIVTSLSKAETSARFLYEKVYCAREARWRTGSRNAKATCSPTEPRAQPCAPTSCGSGSPRSPMRPLCAVRRIGLAHTQFAEATCGTIRLEAPQARRSRPRQRAAYQIRARLSLSLRRRMAAGRRSPRHNRLTRRRNAEKTRQSNPPPTAAPRDRPPSAQTAPGTRSSSPRPLPNLVRSPKTKPRL